MKILIIEDDPDVIEAVSLIFELRWPSAEVKFTGEGLEGLDLVKTESFDLVILDIGLPDEDGFEICRRIRFSSKVPIIILTVKGHEPDKIKGLEMGADDYVTKPFNHQELTARITAVLRRDIMAHDVAVMA